MKLEILNEIKSEIEGYKEIFNSGDFDKALKILGTILEKIEEAADVRSAGSIDSDCQVSKSNEDGRDIYLSLNHVMEYYVYACYFEPETAVCTMEIPIGEYYRTYGELALKLSKYRAAENAYKKAICWNPVDLDSYLGLAECYRNLDMAGRFLEVTKQAYRYCCTRATMARYYRNMGYYFVTEYKPEIARVCYLYSNIYYHTDNADKELAFISEATGDCKTDYSIPDMQKMLVEANVEPGPDSKTIGIVYRVGEIMMQDREIKLAKDCFSIVYDITQEEGLKKLLEEMENEES